MMRTVLFSTILAGVAGSACKDRGVAVAESPLAEANASIFARIDDCERQNGAGGCIYELLRDLASQSLPGGAQGTLTFNNLDNYRIEIKFLSAAGDETVEVFDTSGFAHLHPEFKFGQQIAVTVPRVFALCGQRGAGAERGFIIPKYSVSARGLKRLEDAPRVKYADYCKQAKDEINAWLIN